MKELYKKILLVMNDVGYLQKDDSVQTGGSSYRAITEEKVTSMVGASMRKHGLVIYPIAMTEHREDTEVTRSNGKTGLDRLATVSVSYRIADVDSGESDVIASCGTGVDTQDKAIGKAMTYAYKYMMLRTFAIPTGEDPDKVASDDVQPVKRTPSYDMTDDECRNYTFHDPKQTPSGKAIDSGERGIEWLRAVVSSSHSEQDRYVAKRVLELMGAK